MGFCKRLWLLLLLALLAGPAAAQVGIGILDVDSTAILHLESTERGLLLPRMTTAQRDAIQGPATGLVIYNTTDSVANYWNSVCWLPINKDDCDDCAINLALSDSSGVIDHVTSDSATTDLIITQTFGTPQNIGISVTGNLPSGLTWSVNPNPAFSSGNATVTFKATPFTPPGTYPLIIQAFCGTTIRSIIYVLEVEQCYKVDIVTSVNDFNLETELYNQHPTAPTGVPLCVIADVYPGVMISSSTTANPAFDEGPLPAGSLVGVLNRGMIIGRGGDGGEAYDPTGGLTVNPDGQPGAHALSLTTTTWLQNQGGYVFGGGGGGGSMALFLGFNIGWPLNQTFGLTVGSGGGGGAGGGLGGDISLIGVTYYAPGGDGSTGVFGIPGNGGLLSTPQNIGLGPATVTIDPNTIGGDGGQYGAPGTSGVFQVTWSVTATVPIIGNITVVPPQNVPLPIPPPPGGDGGNAVKRNGNTLQGYTDGPYNTSYIKGVIGN